MSKRGRTTYLADVVTEHPKVQKIGDNQHERVGDERRRKQIAEASRKCRQRRKEEYELLKRRLAELENEIVLVKRSNTVSSTQGLQALHKQHGGVNQLVKHLSRENDSLQSFLEQVQLRLLSYANFLHKSQDFEALLPISPILNVGDSRLAEIPRVRELALSTIRNYKDIFRLKPNQPYQKFVTTSPSWLIDTKTLPQNVVIRFSRKIPNCTAKQLCRAMHYFFTTTDIKWRKQYDDLVHDIEVLREITPNDIVTEDRFSFVGTTKELALTHVVTMEEGADGSYTWVAPAISAWKHTPRDDEINFLRGMHFEDFEDEHTSGVIWDFFVDIARSNATNEELITWASIENFLLVGLPKLETAALIKRDI